MNFALLRDMYYAAPEFWFLLIAVVFLLLGLMLLLWLNLLRLKQKNYFLNRDRERYAETLYASKDGYFAFIYPDSRIKDPRATMFERCSRRLAVILNLPNGTKTPFATILELFCKEDAKNLSKFVERLKLDGLSFEGDFVLKNGKKVFLNGGRVNGIDGNIYCDILWFRDVSFANIKISFFEKSLQQLNSKLLLFENFFNSLPYPAWLRDENLKVQVSNKAYNEICDNLVDILDVCVDKSIKNLPLQVATSNKQKKQTVSMVNHGVQKFVDIIEAPIFADLALDKIWTCGLAIDSTDVNEIKRKLKQSQNSQLEIFGTLGTAFAVFDEGHKLSFYNDSFSKLFGLEKIWLEQKPAYTSFLDVLREKRLMSEVSDFKAFKLDEVSAFHSILVSKEDLIHLPDGRTFKRVRAPYSQGGLVFAYEDISATIAQQSAYTSLINIQKDILNNLFDAVLIFRSNGSLAFYNEAYEHLWDIGADFLQSDPMMLDVLDMQRPHFPNVENWDMFKKELLGHIFNPTTKAFSITRGDMDNIDILSQTLFDGSTMITFRQK